MAEEFFTCGENSPDRVDKILARAFPHKSRALIQRAIEGSKVKRKDGTELEPKTKIFPGEELVLDLSIEEKKSLSPKNIPLQIIFEDEDLVVLNKPSGMVVHPGDGTEDDTLIHAMLYKYPDGLCPVGSPERPGIVHRLDKETSGVMVVARSERAYHSLVKQFADRKTEKTYYALVRGVMKENEGEIDYPIGRHPKIRVKMAVVDHGKPAQTRWEVLSTLGNNFSLLKVKILTGRTHQIRVHFSYLGHPLAGDLTYGAKKSEAFQRVMLHAKTLGFYHPLTNEKKIFETELPEDFKNSLIQIGFNLSR